MPVEIDGKLYFSPNDVAKEAGVSRQTLWRWRQQGRIPAGNRYRGHQVLFTDIELKAILDYARHLEPIEFAGERQLGLFNGKRTEPSES
jgi:hypothetical protein